MYYATGPGWTAAEAERAFGRAVQERRRASLARRLLRRCVACARLAVHDEAGPRSLRSSGAVREIPLDAITGSVEPNRAAHFDCAFRPSAPARHRWVRVWLAEQWGAALPPISVTPVGNGYAVRDGHHRVSVARARGALTISAKIA